MTRLPSGIQAFTAIVGALVLLLAQGTPGRAQERFNDVSLVVAKKTHRPLARDSFQTRSGELTLDAAARELRFEADGRVFLSVSYDRLTTAHYETTKYPPRAFRRVNHLLAISYAGVHSQPESSILQLTKDNWPAVLVALERDTGLRVEQSPSTASPAGLPIHLSVGDSVHVVRDSGPDVEDTVTAVWSMGLRLASTSPLDLSDIRQIRVKDSVWDGALLGAAGGLIPAALLTGSSCFESCSTIGGLTPGGWTVIALGFAAGAGIDAAIMRVAFRRAGLAPARGIVIAPTMTGAERSLRMSIRF